MRSCDAHDDCVVVFDDNECPLCEAERQLENAKDEVANLENEMIKLEEKLASKDE